MLYILSYLVISRKGFAKACDQLIGHLSELQPMSQAQRENLMLFTVVLERYLWGER